MDYKEYLDNTPSSLGLTYDEYADKVIEKVFERFRELNITGKELSQSCGISRYMLRKYKYGEMTPTFKTLDKIKRAMDEIEYCVETYGKYVKRFYP